MKTRRQDVLSEKQILKDELDARMHHFIYSEQKHYVAQHLSILPNRLLSQSTSLYSKKRQSFGNTHIDFISKNNEPEFFVWHTSPKKIEKAIQFGIIKFDSLTSKLICALGSYHKIIINRVYTQGIISDKHELKMALLNFTQDNIKALAPLERLLNTYDDTIPQVANQHRISQELKAYLEKVELNYQNILKLRQLFKEYDSDIESKWKQQTRNIRQLCQKVVREDQDIKTLFDISSQKSLYVFIKQQSIFHI